MIVGVNLPFSYACFLRLFPCSMLFFSSLLTGYSIIIFQGLLHLVSSSIQYLLVSDALILLFLKLDAQNELDVFLIIDIAVTYISWRWTMNFS